MKKVVSYFILIGATAAMGVGVGFASKKLFAPAKVEYGPEGANALKVDAQAIVRKIDSYNGSKDKTEEFTTSEILNYSLEKFRSCENCCSFTYGVADTIVKQDIRGCLIKNGDNYFEESISKSSMVALANRMFQVGKGSDVSLYTANKGTIEISESSPQAEYSVENVKAYSADEYSSTFGKTLDEMFIYIISEDTISTSKVEPSNDGYVISVELRPEWATLNYQLQMVNISDLDCSPEFTDVKLTFTLDKELKLLKMSADEHYTATKFGIPAATHGIIDIYYYSDEFVKIPELNGTVEYKKGV